MRRKLATIAPTRHLLYWICQLCRGDDAHRNVLGSGLIAYGPYLLLLHSFSPDLSLAIDHHYVSLPSFSREKAQCTAKSDRFLRLRSRPTFTRDDTIYITFFPVAHSSCLLSYFYVSQDGHHLPVSGIRYPTRLSQPLSPFCVDAAD